MRSFGTMIYRMAVLGLIVFTAVDLYQFLSIPIGGILAVGLFGLFGCSLSYVGDF